MARNTCERRVGRLIELRMQRGLVSVQDIHDVTENFVRCMNTLPSGLKPVVIGDWRAARVMTEQMFQHATQLFASSNSSLDRVAMLGSMQSPTAFWQLSRLASLADSSEPRRLFKAAGEVAQWLGEVLSREEHQRLERFLAEPVDASREREPFTSTPVVTRDGRS